MKFYLAARYSRIDELNVYANDLRLIGHTVDARWLLGEQQVHVGAREVEAATDDIPAAIGRLFAADDIEDINAADVFVCFTERPDALIPRGGRHVEFGYALALRKTIVSIGPRENIFHCLPEVWCYRTWAEFRSWLITTPAGRNG